MKGIELSLVLTDFAVERGVICQGNLSFIFFAFHHFVMNRLYACNSYTVNKREGYENSKSNENC